MDREKDSMPDKPRDESTPATRSRGDWYRYRGALLSGMSALLMLVTLFVKDPGELTLASRRMYRQSFGWGAFILPLVLGATAVLFILADKPPRLEFRQVGFIVVFVALLAGAHFFALLLISDCPAPPEILEPAYRLAHCGHGGGFVGALVYTTLHDLIGGAGVLVSIFLLTVVGSKLMIGGGLKKPPGWSSLTRRDA